MNFLGVYGHVVLDHVVRVPALPKPNASVSIESESLFFGGTGANIARMASRLGVRTALASFVGEDFPKEYYDALKSDGVELRDLRVVRGHKTPYCYVFSDGRDQQNFIHQGPMARADDLELLKHTVKDSRIVHIGTGSPVYYGKIAALAHKLGREVAFDPGQEIHYVYGPKSFEALLERSRYFFCNEVELKRALEYTGSRKPSDLLDRVEVLVNTKGAKGADIYRGAKKYSIPAIKPRKFVDATGAGDAFRAGFYAALSRNFDTRKCGLAGAAGASLKLESLGAQTNMPDWGAVKKRAGI